MSVYIYLSGGCRLELEVAVSLNQLPTACPIGVICLCVWMTNLGFSTYHGKLKIWHGGSHCFHLSLVILFTPPKQQYHGDLNQKRPFASFALCTRNEQSEAFPTPCIAMRISDPIRTTQIIHHINIEIMNLWSACDPFKLYVTYLLKSSSQGY